MRVAKNVVLNAIRSTSLAYLTAKSDMQRLDLTSGKDLLRRCDAIGP